jgi:sulfur-carrier protein adenylyltransferase/sulfurtransferase
MNSELSNDEIKRYSRHLLLPEVGMEGQRKLKSASVAVIGVGGLGSPLSLYLAAAGVGRLGLVDFDQVETSNLQRQIIHSTKDVGRPKLASAEEKLRGLNPSLQVDQHEEKLSSQNALKILGDYDVVVDGTDNFQTRYLVNDACVLLKKPNVYASIFRFEGQLSIFYAEQGPCYRCLYPEPPPPGLVPSCAEGGVLGVLPGIVGTLQAMETIKLLLGIGESAIGRLILFDALKLQFREFKLRKDKNCAICSTSPQITQLIDYDAFCGMRTTTAPPTSGVGFEITPQEFKQRRDQGEDLYLLDVREPHEYAIANLGGTLIPLSTLPGNLAKLDPAREIVVHCHHGGRSAQAVKFLRENGFAKARNLAGGIDLWAIAIDPKLPRY